jgi:hypothetical protein
MLACRELIFDPVVVCLTHGFSRGGSALHQPPSAAMLGSSIGIGSTLNLGPTSID